jgi:hypothetical protein
MHQTHLPDQASFIRNAVPPDVSSFFGHIRRRSTSPTNSSIPKPIAFGSRVTNKEPPFAPAHRPPRRRPIPNPKKPSQSKNSVARD